jgi:hypothetical protein
VQNSVITRLPSTGTSHLTVHNKEQNASLEPDDKDQEYRINLLWTILASISFAITAWFVRATFSAARLATMQETIHISLSNTLGILRTLQEVTSVLTGFVLNQTFETIEWSLASGDGGIRVLSFLSLSPTTSLLGVAGIVSALNGKVTDRL